MTVLLGWGYATRFHLRSVLDVLFHALAAMHIYLVIGDQHDGSPLIHLPPRTSQNDVSHLVLDNIT